MGCLALLVLLLSAGYANAQKSKLKLAAEYAQTFDYRKAAEIYEDIVEKSPNNVTALRLAADCWKKIGNYTRNEELLFTLHQLEGAYWADTLNYAQALKINGKYNQAVDIYKAYAKNNPSDDYVKTLITDNDWLHKTFRDSSLFDIVNSPENSEFSDFAPAFLNEEIYFSSARAEGKGKANIYSWNDQSYLNLFKASPGTDRTLVNAALIPGKTNSRFHEGTIAYDQMNNLVYITRNYWNKGVRTGSESGNLNLAIFRAGFVDGEIGELEEFEHNNPEYSVGHPTITTDGSKMFFVSDMPEGRGGTDIYFCERDSAGAWAKPENLSSINSPTDEMFPYLYNDSILYFASDGFPGLGGMDVYYIELYSPQKEVQSIGYPINSSMDDFSIIIGKDRSWGYYASNRAGGMGDDDIYYWAASPPDSVTISGLVYDTKSKEPVPGAAISYNTSATSNVEIAGISNSEGKYEIVVPYEESYTIFGNKEWYLTGDTTVNSNPTSAFIDNADIGLRKYDYLVQGTVMYADNDQPAEGALVSLIDGAGEVIETATTPENGTYQFPLMANNDYIVRCFKEGFPEQELEITTKNRKEKIITVDFRLFKLEEGVVVRMDNIYYDFNKANIRPDAEPELNKLAKIMEDNPTMTIELSSHTDSRGSDSYNKNLSQKRAKSAIDYINSRGIDKSRLKSVGYGESKLLNKCDDGVECSEEEHQLNRRTEFKILDI
jgi:outer membrane protein OmpA-like peptidoglycan-associated protein/tetratricopeptide (TPR) repeat protein